MQTDSITSDKISNGAVGNANIADNSITSDKILDGSITSKDLATGTGFTDKSQGQASQVIFSTCSIDFDVVAAQKVKTAFCPVPGAKIGDHVIVTNQDLTLGLVTQSATVNGTELVRIAVTNPSLSSVDPPQRNLGINHIQVMTPYLTTYHAIICTIARNQNKGKKSSWILLR